VVWTWLLRHAREGELNSYRRTLAPASRRRILPRRTSASAGRSGTEADVVAPFKKRRHSRHPRAGAVQCPRRQRVSSPPRPRSRFGSTNSCHRHTNAGTFTAESVYVCSSWASTLLPALGIDWKIALSRHSQLFRPRPTCATSRLTGSGVDMDGEPSSTGAASTARWRSRSPGTSASLVRSTRAL